MRESGWTYSQRLGAPSDPTSGTVRPSPEIFQSPDALMTTVVGVKLE